MNVCRIAEQKRAPFPEMLRYTVMNTISRKPVDFFDINLVVLDHPSADILEFERIGPVGAVVTDRPDQSGASLPCKRKHRKEIGFFEVDVHRSQ
jgi:hypothetical protein